MGVYHSVELEEDRWTILVLNRAATYIVNSRTHNGVISIDEITHYAVLRVFLDFCQI
jgi:hypothetical protein